MNYFPFWLDFNDINKYNRANMNAYNQENVYPLLNAMNLPIFYQSPQTIIENQQFFQNINQQKPSQNVQKLKKSIIQTFEYQPSSEINQNKQSKQKQKKQKTLFKQKQGRNMMSNLFRQAVKSILQEKDQTADLIQNIAFKYKIDVNIKTTLESVKSNCLQKEKTHKNQRSMQKFLGFYCTGSYVKMLSHVYVTTPKYRTQID